MLLSALDPELASGPFVFALARDGAAPPGVEPFATVREAEGLTLVLPHDDADRAGLPYDGEFARITLRVHSALDAVGLTAAVSAALAACGISANVIAGLHHDHVFVQASRAHDALDALTALAAASRCG